MTSARPALAKFVFGLQPPDSTLERVRATFPDIDILAAPGDAFIQSLPGAQAAFSWSMTPAEYAAADQLVWFQSVGAGVERVILPGMAERGLLLTNSSGIHSENISEHLLALMFAFARRLPVLIRGQVQRQWREDIRPSTFELNGQTLLVVGYGDIGSSLGRKAEALGMRVIGVRRNVSGPKPTEIAKLGSFADLPELVAEADHVAICLPQTPETIGLFDSSLIDQMKSGSYIYNIGRGPIIVTSALIDALERGHLGGAGLDVTDPEPLPADSPLWERSDVIISAHTAGATPNFWPRLTEIIVDNIGRYVNGDPLAHQVQLDLGY